MVLGNADVLRCCFHPCPLTTALSLRCILFPLLHREGKTSWQDLDLDDVDVRLKWAGLFHRRKRTPGRFMMRLKVGWCGALSGATCLLGWQAQARPHAAGGPVLPSLKGPIMPPNLPPPCHLCYPTPGAQRRADLRPAALPGRLHCAVRRGRLRRHHHPRQHPGEPQATPAGMSKPSRMVHASRLGVTTHIYSCALWCQPLPRLLVRPNRSCAACSWRTLTASSRGCASAASPPSWCVCDHTSHLPAACCGVGCLRSGSHLHMPAACCGARCFSSGTHRHLPTACCWACHHSTSDEWTSRCMI